MLKPERNLQPLVFWAISVALCLSLQNERDIAHAQSQPQISQVNTAAIVIKFKPNTPLCQTWLQQGRTGELFDLKPFLSNTPHTTTPYIDDGTLRAVEQRASQISEYSPRSFSDPLRRICVLHTKNSAGLERVVAKLSRHNAVEYAEILPSRSIADTTNDPLLGEQTYLNVIRIFQAWNVWQVTVRDTTPVVIAIVDTGIDYNHEDLRNVLFTNSGETGRDAQGRDKRTNGVDDDNNGKIDDWRGWDFSGADGQTQDNDPRPGNQHGTHVAGIAGAQVNNAIGIAGVMPRARLLPVKVSKDDGDRFIYGGSPAILYAAALGARVINCSWGDEQTSQAERDAVQTAQRLGSLIIAAAGNQNSQRAHYPAALPGVVSVAATDDTDEKAGLSNFDSSVDISAPGSLIFSTFPENRYGYLTGTSMSTPIVAGLAALVHRRFPAFSNEQIIAQIRATADAIDTKNPEFIGLLGAGRVNAFQAVSRSNAQFVAIDTFTVQDANNNGILEPGERIELTLTVRNMLAALENMDALAQITAQLPAGSPFQPQFEQPSLTLAPLRTGDKQTLRFAFRLSATQTENLSLPLICSFGTSTNARLFGREALTLIVNQSYRTLAGNATAVTLTSGGNIGFNDYPANSQGTGFSWKRGANLLYEGALMIASGKDSISTAARAAFGTRDRSFLASSLLRVVQPDSVRLEARTAFGDRNGRSDAGVFVEQTATQSRQTVLNNAVFLEYRITNTAQRNFSELYAGLFMDWDIGSAIDNEAFYDEESRSVIVRNARDTAQPLVGIRLLSEQPVNVYMINSDDEPDTVGTVSFFNGFTRADKWKVLSSGLTKTRSRVADVVAVIGAGPMRLATRETLTVRFVIGAAESLPALRNTMNMTRMSSLPVVHVYPNPVAATATVQYDLPNEQAVTLRLYNAVGQLVQTFFDAPQAAGRHDIQVLLDNLAAGQYFIRLQTADFFATTPLTISR